MKYYISIHDASPNNFQLIKKIVHILINKYQINKFCILVIPGLDWQDIQIQQLLSWQQSGLEIAAHGWRHRCERKKNIYHLIHGLIISDNSAEHLSKNKNAIFNLIIKSYNWFVDNKFVPPTLYVPPGWALGKINSKDFLHLPFFNYECTTGLCFKNQYLFLPLIGFKASSLSRGMLQRLCNTFNYLIARFIGIVRITIHPNDFQLVLSKDANNYLSNVNDTILLKELSL